MDNEEAISYNLGHKGFWDWNSVEEKWQSICL